VSATSGNTGNLLEFEIPSGNTGNLLEFTCFSWKLFYNRSMSDDCLAAVRLFGNWLAQLTFLS